MKLGHKQTWKKFPWSKKGEERINKQGLPWWTSLAVQWLRLWASTAGVWFQSLVGELKSHTLQVAAKNKKIWNFNKWKDIPCLKLTILFLINFYWSIVALQCWVSFYCTAKWISLAYTYASSLLTFFPFRSPPRALSRVSCAIQHVLISYLFYT